MLRAENAADPQPAEVVSGFYGESAAFIESLSQGRAPAPDLADALRSVEIAESVQRAIDKV
jgi:predicted dehydrogenase